MDRVHETLLAVWREACRPGIEGATDAVAGILRAQFPVERLVILAFDWVERTVTVVAEAGGAASVYSAPQRRLNPAAADDLRIFAEQGLLQVSEDGQPVQAAIALLLPDAPRSTWFICPLRNSQAPTGALLVQLSARAQANPAMHKLAAALAEPFAIALDNDRRLQELALLREVAEADKRPAVSSPGHIAPGDTIVGSDGGLGAVMQRVNLIAKSDIPILILGETGTGKEVVARAIHDHSPRAGGPFIRVNCGAISPELIDSELFGHDKGAFSGAIAARRGWFERADGGTLLLDEVAELSLAAQVRLLRVLQEGNFERVGGELQHHVDVRIIAATHRDLPAMVQHRQFREDLWYRISGFPIVLPPLRERRTDIPALAAHFAARAARRFGLRPQQPSPADIELLMAYDWPGNIRELQSVIDRAAILGDGRSLEFARALGNPAGPASSVPATASAGAAIAPIDSAMRTHIEHALRMARGRIEGSRGAAQMLAINPHTLRARMRKLGIDWRRFRD